MEGFMNNRTTTAARNNMNSALLEPLAAQQIVYPSLEAIAALSATAAANRKRKAIKVEQNPASAAAAAAAAQQTDPSMAALAAFGASPLTAAKLSSGWAALATASLNSPEMSTSNSSPSSMFHNNTASGDVDNSFGDGLSNLSALLGRAGVPGFGNESLEPARKLVHHDPSSGLSMSTPATPASGVHSDLLPNGRKKPGRKPAMQEPANKRTAQNRAAQRAFRERKEQYVRDLEMRVEALESEKNQLSALVSQSNVVATAAAAVVARAAGNGSTPSPAMSVDVANENSLLRQRISQLEKENSLLREMNFSFDFSGMVNPASGNGDARDKGKAAENMPFLASPSSNVTPSQSPFLADQISPSPPGLSATVSSPPTTLNGSSPFSDLFGLFDRTSVEPDQPWDSVSIPGVVGARPPNSGSFSAAGATDNQSFAAMLLAASNKSLQATQQSANHPDSGSPGDILNAFLLGEASSASLLSSWGAAGGSGADDSFAAFLNEKPGASNVGEDMWMTPSTSAVSSSSKEPAGWLPSSSAATAAALADIYPKAKSPAAPAAAATAVVVEEGENGEMCQLAHAAARSCLPQEDPKVIDELCDIFKTKAQCTELRGLQHKIVDACERGDRDQVLELMEICKEKRRMRMLRLKAGVTVLPQS
ncbi:hypothetical protein DFJ73DRAFT_814514 [Zopfochytrium polystomum]|nr:hypothetical protein DFJ73DRAFT_814514 [Zopfochytrium polystomum]